MLAYYVEWHMRRALVPLLFDDDPTAAEASRSSPSPPRFRLKPSASLTFVRELYPVGHTPDLIYVTLSQLLIIS